MNLKELFYDIIWDLVGLFPEHESIRFILKEDNKYTIIEMYKDNNLLFKSGIDTGYLESLLVVEDMPKDRFLMETFVRRFLKDLTINRLNK